MKNNKKIYLYPIDVEPLEEGGFLAECPSLQGCHAEGETYGKAIENIQDVIQIHIAERLKHKDPLAQVSMPKEAEFRLSLPLPIFA